MVFVLFRCWNLHTDTCFVSNVSQGWHQEVAQHKCNDMRWPDKLIHGLSPVVHASLMQGKYCAVPFQ